MNLNCIPRWNQPIDINSNWPFEFPLNLRKSDPDWPKIESSPNEHCTKIGLNHKQQPFGRPCNCSSTWSAQLWSADEWMNRVTHWTLPIQTLQRGDQLPLMERAKITVIVVVVSESVDVSLHHMQTSSGPETIWAHPVRLLAFIGTTKVVSWIVYLEFKFTLK